MHNLQISVAIITYNQEQYIAQAINSILAQKTDFAYELVIGEDCSTDSTRSIVIDYQKRYPAIIRVITSANNVGMVPNLIRTIRACRGSHIAFCEGDDYWIDTRKLQKQIGFMLENPGLSMCYHAVRVECADGSVAPGSRRDFTGNKILRVKEVILGGGNIFKFTTTMVRRDVVEDLPLWYEKSPITDVPLALIAASKGDVGYLDEVMSVYRYHLANSWSTRIYHNFENRLEYIMRMAEMRKEFDKYTNFRYSDWIKRRTSRNYRRILTTNPIDRDLRKKLYRQFKEDMILLDRLVVLLACYINIPLLRHFLAKKLT